MLHCIQISMNTWLWSPNAGNAPEKIILHKTTNILEHMLMLSLHIIWPGCSLFYQWNENSTTWLQSLYKVLSALWMSHGHIHIVAGTHCNVMKHSIEICFLWGKGHLWIVFGFNMKICTNKNYKWNVISLFISRGSSPIKEVPHSPF